MTRIVVMFFLLIGPAVASAETQILNFTNFDEVSVGHGMRLSISQGETYRVSTTGDLDDLRLLEVRHDGNRLAFSIQSGFVPRFRSVRIHVDITMPVLRRLNLSGGSHGNLEMGMGSQPFTAQMSGGSSLNGRVSSGDTSLTLSGGSKAALSGSVADLKLSGSGGSRYDLKDLAATDVRANLSGGSQAMVTLSGEVSANLSGGSQVIFHGSAALGSVRASGGSRIRKGV